jgi:hypothetical protein
MLLGDPAHPGQDRLGQVGLAVQQVADPLHEQRRGPPGAVGGQPRPGGGGVGPHPGHAVVAQQGLQQGHGGVQGGVGWRRRTAALGRGRPPLGGGGAATQRLQLRPEHGQMRVTVDQAPVLEPAEPAAHRLHPPAGVGGEGQGDDQAGDPVGVPGGLAVVDGQLGQALGLIPVGGPPVELGHPLGLAPLQLGQEQLPEQLVVAVPAVAAVHLDQRQLGIGQRRQHPVRPADAEDRVAQRPGQLVEHGRAGEEGHGRLREPVQQAGRRRGGRRVTVAGDRRPRGGPPALAGRRRGGQVQPHRPALGPLQQLGDLGLAGPDAGVLEQRPGLLARPWPARRARPPAAGRSAGSGPRAAPAWPARPWPAATRRAAAAPPRPRRPGSPGWPAARGCRARRPPARPWTTGWPRTSGPGWPRTRRPARPGCGTAPGRPAPPGRGPRPGS